MRVRGLGAGLLVVGLLAVGGCGDPTYQTRYMPRASELTYAAEYEQLVWQPPALDREPPPRANPTSPIPRPGADAMHDVEKGATGYRYAGDDFSQMQAR